MAQVDSTSASVFSANLQTDSLAACAGATFGTELIVQIVGIVS